MFFFLSWLTILLPVITCLLALLASHGRAACAIAYYDVFGTLSERAPLVTPVPPLATTPHAASATTTPRAPDSNPDQGTAASVSSPATASGNATPGIPGELTAGPGETSAATVPSANPVEPGTPSSANGVGKPASAPATALAASAGEPLAVPTQLHAIALEDIHAVLTYLRHTPPLCDRINFCGPDCGVTLMGVARGAEAALLLGGSPCGVL